MRIDRKKLVIAMMDADMNVAQLAESAHTSRATISAIRGGKSCTDAIGRKIAEALRVPVETLLEK